MDAAGKPVILSLDASSVAGVVLRKAAAGVASVVTARTPGEALARLDATVDIVVTSLVLAGSSGQAFARAVRDTRPDLRVLAVSGSVNDQIAARAIGKDLFDYFDKQDGPGALGLFLRAHLLPTTRIDGRVLHIEDSRTILVSTKRALEQFGLVVEQEPTGRGALEALDAGLAGSRPLPDVVLSDVQLKDTLGALDILTELGRRPAWALQRIPTIITTGDDSPERQAALVAAGADDVIEKPLVIEQVIPRIRYRIERGKLQRTGAA